MEQMELEAEVYAALMGDSALVAKLPKGDKDIHHLISPADKSTRYPHIVYSVSSDSPQIHGDNAEMYHDVSIRLHIVTKDGEYKDIYEDVKRIMLSLGFMRRATTPYEEDGLKVLVCDFRKMIPA